MSEEESDDAGCKYAIRLVIKHPTLRPEEITEQLRLVPHLCHTVGHPRRTPAGTSLPGVYRESVWGYTKGVEGKRAFFDDVVALIDALEPSAAYLVDCAETGGRMFLAVDLLSDANIGDLLSWPQLARLSALRIDLGVEVFV
jgi:hypothetical protein